MDKEKLQSLYERYVKSSSKTPRLNMRAYWNDYVAHALAFAIGVEDSQPAQDAYERIRDYYVENRLVASQQLVDAFIAHAATAILEEREERAELTLDAVGIAPEVVGKLSRFGITSLKDIYANEIDLTDRQFNLLVEGLIKNLRRVAKEEGAKSEEESNDAAPASDDTSEESTDGNVISEPVSDSHDAAPSEAP